MYQSYGTVNIIPASHKPISAWGYFGYRVLYSIPIIGWIFLIVHAICASNINVRRHARSYFCTFLVVVLLTAALVALIIATGALDKINPNSAEIEQALKNLMDVLYKK